MTGPPPDGFLDALASRVSAALGDRYVIGHLIGAGAQATVFQARDLKHKRTVAVKVLRQELASTVSAERFLREILIAAGLTHPNILPVFDSGSEHGLVYYVMPYIKGETLADRIEREGALPLAEALRLTHEIGAALQHAHDHGLVHRDVKPANVLLSGGVAVVADFGLARALESSGSSALELTSEGAGMGTPSYMSPEQALGSGDLGPATDQYSLACVLFEMLTGRRPYEGTSLHALVAAHVTAEPPDASRLSPEVPKKTAAAIRSALAKEPRDRFPSVSAFVAAAEGSGHDTIPARRGAARARPLSWKVSGTLVGVAAVAAAWLGWSRFGPGAAGTALDPDLVAVAPFSAPEQQLAVWREGLAEIVARNLDGAGRLRTVSMTVVNQRWRGGGDSQSLEELGRRTGAASAVAGTLLQKGRDSVQLTGTVYDVAGGRSLGEVDLIEAAGQMGGLAERFTIEVLRRLGKSSQLAEARLAAAHTTPLPALKAFLQGEYHFRRTAWDSAMGHYRQAIELDPGMALAFLRMAMVNEWQHHADSITSSYARQAARLNRGLAPRESLLVEAENLKATLGFRFGDSAYASHAEQLFRTLETATRQYPDDRELWHSLGHARAHVAGKIRGALDALDRSIAIDSGFAPAYLDAVMLSMALGEPLTARRYLDAYLALNPSDVHADGLRLASALLDPRPASARVQSVLDTASADLLVRAIDVLAYWTDSAETTVQLARRLVTARRFTVPAYGDPDFRAFQLAYPLSFRGHLKEAYQVWHGSSDAVRALITASLVMMNAAPPDEAAAFFAELRRGPVDRPTGLVLAFPWWSAQGDSISLRLVAERAEAASRGRVVGSGGRYARYLGAASRGYLALARADTTDALTRFLALNPADCMYPFCPYEPLQTAMLLARRKRDPEAWKILDDIPNLYNPISVRWRLERARVAERLGLTDEAIRAYTYVAAIWRHADPELQPEVREAEAGRRRLQSGASRAAIKATDGPASATER